MAHSLLVGKTYNVVTFGCQMNLHESERVSGLLDESGCIAVATPAEADIVVYMTCTVREKADDHLYGAVTNLVSAPVPPCGRRVVAVGGCIAQRDGERLREMMPNVDVVFGTQALASLPPLLEDVFSEEGSFGVDVSEPYDSFSTSLPTRRAQRFHAWVPIMYGCDNFCTYCIVPHVRGRERSREMADIVAECERLVADGVREITLLGQNVNSYGRNIYGEPRFAELLRQVDATGIERLRFTSSNPKDLSADVISAMAETPCVMPQLHLAVQSGSTRILKAMNRRYTRDDYLRLVSDIREAMPDISLSTDIIVGFPGEQEQDFLDTLSLVREVGFSSAYTFIYSRRAGTPAAKMIDDTPHEVIQERFERLAELVAELAHTANEPFAGQVVETLVEGVSKRNAQVMVGHSPRMQTVHFDLPVGVSSESLVGTMCDIQVDEARTWYLRGQLVGDPH